MRGWGAGGEVGGEQEERKGADWMGGKLWEQSRANYTDAGQVWRECQAGEEHRRQTLQRHHNHPENTA